VGQVFFDAAPTLSAPGLAVETWDSTVTSSLSRWFSTALAWTLLLSTVSLFSTKACIQPSTRFHPSE
jgi:hypothetical protein